MATSDRTDGMERDDTASRSGTEHPARDRLYEQARGTTHDIQEMSGLATAAAQEQLGQIGDAAFAYFGQGHDKVKGVVGAFEQYVRERPVKSLLIAAGLGLLFGRLWMRR